MLSSFLLYYFSDSKYSIQKQFRTLHNSDIDQELRLELYDGCGMIEYYTMRFFHRIKYV